MGGTGGPGAAHLIIWHRILALGVSVVSPAMLEPKVEHRGRG
jgi:hypothetical protein